MEWKIVAIGFVIGFVGAEVIKRIVNKIRKK
jgi:hypothetical protein